MSQEKGPFFADVRFPSQVESSCSGVHLLNPES